MFLTYFILFLNFTFSTKIIFDDDHKHHGDILLNDSISIQDDKLVRTNMDRFVDSPTGNFRVHFDTSGVEAVSTLDEDFNGIPDYIDSTIIFLEHSYDVEVNQLGWNKPLSDSSLSDNGGSGAVDVYIMDLSTVKTSRGYGIYGLADPIQYSFADGNSGILFLDNNYTDDVYYTLSYEGLKVTIAHEFHHIIQFSYSDYFPSPIVFEMISTYMEDKVFYGVFDMKNYVNHLFKSIISYPIANAEIEFGYMYNIYLHYLDLKYGHQIVEELWISLLGKNAHFINTWDDYLQENYNVSIGETFTEFYEWCYYTGDKSIEGQYFPFAEEFNGMKANKVYTYSDPSISDTKNLTSMAFNYFQVIYPYTESGSTNDTIDVLITNTTTKISDNIPYTETYFFASSNKSSNDNKKLSNIDYYVQTNSPEKFNYQIIEYPGLHPEDFAGPSPSPYKISQHGKLLFPVGENHQAFEKVELQILSSNMKSIHREKISIEIINNKKVISFSNNNILNSSGVYYYTIKSKDDSKFGKFAVVK